jgi:asparagine synthase (glutamine-hydrolysing)
MCGISGIIGDKANKVNIAKLTQSQHHRGYDNIDHYINQNCALGHNRLSIIDLNSSANQPFQKSNCSYVMVFNGEIYNYIEIKEELKTLGYKFETSSDTEVLYNAFLEWGENCLNKLNGMFAFAIWDEEQKHLFAARDRFGVKPFYYYQDDENLIFASEIKAIHQLVETKLNHQVLANYLMYGSYGLPNETFYDNIYQLPGGHQLAFKNNQIHIKAWYDFVERVKIRQQKLSETTEAEAINQYKTLVENSIDLRFRADVPVGFTLSGGVDSSLLLALVNQREDADQIKAYTFYTDDERYDELPWVQQIKLHKVCFKADDFKSWHERISYHQDESYGGLPTLAYAKLFQKISNDGIKVILDGQGMDEAWAGYDYYQTSSTQTIQGQSKSSPFKTNVLSKNLKQLAQKPNYPKPFKDELLDKQYRDLFYTKIPRALRFNDRISMAATTELREPFLDYNLVEFAFSLPKKYKIHNGQGKYLLRKILSDYSQNVAFAPKRPLQTPQREWLGKELKREVDKSIRTIEKSSLSKWFDLDQLQKEWEVYQNGDQNSSFHLWQWISVSKFAEYEK